MKRLFYAVVFSAISNVAYAQSCEVMPIRGADGRINNVTMCAGADGVWRPVDQVQKSSVPKTKSAYLQRDHNNYGDLAAFSPAYRFTKPRNGSVDDFCKNNLNKDQYIWNTSFCVMIPRILNCKSDPDSFLRNIESGRVFIKFGTHRNPDPKIRNEQIQSAVWQTSSACSVFRKSKTLYVSWSSGNQTERYTSEEQFTGQKEAGYRKSLVYRTDPKNSQEQALNNQYEAYLSDVNKEGEAYQTAKIERKKIQNERAEAGAETMGSMFKLMVGLGTNEDMANLTRAVKPLADVLVPQDIAIRHARYRRYAERGQVCYAPDIQNCSNSKQYSTSYLGRGYFIQNSKTVSSCYGLCSGKQGLCDSTTGLTHNSVESIEQQYCRSGTHEELSNILSGQAEKSELNEYERRIESLTTTGKLPQ